MVRRSAPFLPGLVVCLLFAVHPSGASSALRLDESKIRVSLEESQTRVSLEVESGEARAFDARVTVALLDPRDKVRSEGSTEVSVRRGRNSFSVPLKLPYSELIEAEREQFPWYRVRYRVAPAGDAPSAVEGVVSLSEAAPDLFELRVTAPDKARAGSTLRARVRAANPATGRPVKSVAVAGELKFDGGATPSAVKASAETGGDGLAVLDFTVPREAGGDGELKVEARLGALAEEAGGEVSLDEAPRLIVTTDKALYQPGQLMRARALVFDPTEHAVSNGPVVFKLEDEDDAVVCRAEAQTSRYGIAAADCAIPESAKLGWYFLYVGTKAGGREEEHGGARRIVRVSRYDLPNFTVSAKPDSAYYLPGRSAEVSVRGDYLFGEPVKRGHVRVARQTERSWNYEKQKYEVEEEEPVEGELDERGGFVAQLDLSDAHEDLADSDYSRFRDITYTAYVTDPTTNRTEQRRFAVRLTKDPIHVYVNEGRYSQAKGLPLAFYLSTFYADGRPAQCEVTVSEEGETNFTRRAGGALDEVKEPDRPVVKVRTNRYGVARVVGPTFKRDDERGNVKLRFLARDGAGRAGRDEEDFWLKRYRRAETPEIRVETDKTIYREGEPVTVVLASDAERVSAYVDVSAGGRVLYSQPVRLAGGRAVVVVPYSAEFRGVVTVSAASADPYGKDDNEDYAFGARIIVFPRDRELKLDVRMSQAKYRPGEEASAQLAVRTPSGGRAEGAFGVVVFDKAVEERARADDESPSAWGFGDSLDDFWYSTYGVAGITQRDIERLDLSRPVPAGLDEVAEVIFNGERFYGELHGFAGTRFIRDRAAVFQDLVAAQLKPARDALARRYDAAAEYPSDAASLARMLSAAGIDFGALRDPWGRPYRAGFYAAGDQDFLEILSDGPDEREGTDDDFTAARLNRPYFRKAGEALNRAAADYHARTGAYVRDFATLEEETRRAGVDLAALRDPWGQSYSFEFGASGSSYTIRVRSGGPNKSFEPTGAEGSDDFTLWTNFADYFAGWRSRIDEALARDAGETGGLPADEGALRAALKRHGVDFDALRDGWGRKPYAVFPTVTRFADRVTISARARPDGASDTRRDYAPVTQVVRSVSLRSAGADRAKGTADDFTLGLFTSVTSEQSARGASARPAPVLVNGAGAIAGTVKDPQGAVVAGAKVTAKHTYAELTFEAMTNEEGSYLLRDLPSGLYDVTVEASGFALAVVKGVQVHSSNLTTADVILSVGGTTETVEVSAGGPARLETSMSSESETKTRATVSRMPLSTPRLREFFPETLVWQPAVETDREGRAEVRFKLADNITTWKMSVIASTEDGRVGVFDKEFISTQPFFVEHEPPRVLTEGDRISLPVVLRNYLERAQPVDVELKPETWFAPEGPARLRAEAPAGDAARATFDFRAVASVKDGKQRVTATGLEASDAVEKPVTVHPDGEERAVTDSSILSSAGALSFDVPADAVGGSVRSELKIYPSLSAHLLEGVEAIMERPYGCGEQTISSAYPSLLALRYYEQNGRLDIAAPTPAAARALRYARQGYERLLNYRAPGGGFTYWGRGEPDVALTAYALRFLSAASRFVAVDEDVIDETRAWLVSRQRADGSWPARHWWEEKEDPRQTAMLTALVARALAATRGPENQSAPAPSQFAQAQTQPSQTQAQPAQTQSQTSTPQAAAAQKQSAPQPPPLERALRYLAARASEVDEPYLIASYALASADAGDDEALSLAARKLAALAHGEGAGSYWSLETNTPFYGWGLAGRIETTALAVKALNRYCGMPNADCGLKKDEGNAAVNSSPANPKSEIRIPQLIERGLLFLLRSKDRYGVWYSTQATVNVHDALASLVAEGDGATGGGAAEVFVNGRRAGALEMPAANQLTGPLLFDLSPFVSAGDNRVEVRRAGGAARAQAQVVTTFYAPWPKHASGAETTAKGGDASLLRLAVSYDKPSASINQEVTCSVLAERIGHSGYGMMLAEVGLPPGADVDRASLERTMKESGWAVNSYDVLPDRLVVYLWPEGGGTRFQFKFRPRYGLDALTAPSTLYDYYNPEAHAVVAPTRFVVR